MLLELLWRPILLRIKNDSYSIEVWDVFLSFLLLWKCFAGFTTPVHPSANWHEKISASLGFYSVSKGVRAEEIALFESTDGVCRERAEGEVYYGCS
jgi:hypothetical protein